jgi:hypothetical protein
MSKQSANGVEISSLVEQVGGKAVTKGMNTLAVDQTGFFFALR